MKKKLMAFILTVMMVLSLGVQASATAESDAPVNAVYEGTTGYDRNIHVRYEKTGLSGKIIITKEDGTQDVVGLANGKFVETGMFEAGLYYAFYNEYPSQGLTLNGKPAETECSIYASEFSGNTCNFKIKLLHDVDAPEYSGIALNVDLTLVEDPAPKQMQASFMTHVVTPSGQYEMYISGYLGAELVPGSNVLTAAQISAQGISVHARHIPTGTMRTLTQSTIEGMTLNVSGGQITSVDFNGRVQTPNGSLERYSATATI